MSQIDIRQIKGLEELLDALSTGKVDEKTLTDIQTAINETLQSLSEDKAEKTALESLDKAITLALQQIESGKANKEDLHKIATSGSYNDLDNKPTIPVVPAISKVGLTNSYNDLDNKPTIPVVPTISKVGLSNSYNDLDNKPTIVIPTVDKTSLGLDKVNNTSDANKPVSILQQQALDKKVNLIPDGIMLVSNNNLNWNDVAFTMGGLTISQITTPNYTGQSNYPYFGFGQLLTFTEGCTFPFQLAVYENGKMFFRCCNSYGYPGTIKFTNTWTELITKNDLDWEVVPYTKPAGITFGIIQFYLNRKLKLLSVRMDGVGIVKNNGDLVATINLPIEFKNTVSLRHQVDLDCIGENKRKTGTLDFNTSGQLLIYATEFPNPNTQFSADARIFSNFIYQII